MAGQVAEVLDGSAHQGPWAQPPSYAEPVLMRGVLTVVTGALVLVTTACSPRTGTPRAAVQPGRTSPHASQSSGPGQRPARPSPAASPRPATPGQVTLAFAGDVNFARRTARLLREPATAFAPIAPVLRSADFTAVNLETSVTSRGRPQPKTYHFRTTPLAFTALRDAGIDLVTMANNHVLDYGQTGLADTLTAARAARFPQVGIGRNAAAAWAPYLTTIHGVRIAMIGVSQVTELAPSWVATSARPGEANAINARRTLAAVRAAKRLAQVVVVFMHWGTEGQPCPDPAQLALAPRLARAGASIIIGAHAHVLQGSGWLGHTFVGYGMGNFLWWEHSYSTATGVLELTLHPHGPLTARFRPATVSRTGQPVPDHGARARRALARYASLRACTGLARRPS
jgi:poly-gamma-glutamate capsule biosynthesis protein CapA/YwtB (metallophosphatase superfamily)